MTQSTYVVIIECGNCKEDTYLHVPKGVTVNRFLNRRDSTNNQCTHCECYETLIHSTARLMKGAT